MHSFALRYRLFTEGTSTAACSVNVLSASFCSYNCCVDFTLQQKGLKLEPFSISHIQNLCNFSDPLIDFIILPKKDIKSIEDFQKLPYTNVMGEKKALYKTDWSPEFLELINTN